MFLGVGDTVNGHRAHSADSLAAIVVEVNRVFAVLDESFVDDVDHFEEGSRCRDFLGLVRFDTAFGIGIFLTPDFESEIEQRHGLLIRAN